MVQKDSVEKPTLQKSKYEMDMCSGSILKKMLLFSVPLILSSVLQLLFNTADVIVVGKFAGPEALSAVGSTGASVTSGSAVGSTGASVASGSAVGSIGAIVASGICTGA